MSTIKSNYFLLDKDSFFTETNVKEGTSLLKRSGIGNDLTQTEKDIAGDYYNSSANTIDYAEIYNLDFGPNFMTKLGASDDWMAKALTDKSYKDAFKKATDKTGPNLSFASAIEASKNWDSSPLNTDANGKSNVKKLRGSVGGTLYYPLNRDRKNYDYLKVTAMEYKPNEFGQEGGITRDAEDRNMNPLGSVMLPMQPGLADSSAVDWGDSTINALEAGAASIAGNTIKGAGKGGAEALAGLMSGSKETFEKVFGKGGITPDDVATYFAGQAIGKNDLMQRTTGKMMNPNLELLFTGPTLRSFTYSYKFTPREDKEARMIRSIIRFFKKHMAVKREKKGALFLKSPDVFKLKYMYKGGRDHPYLNKIKLCALRSFDVQYTPDGSYMTYDDGSMTSYQVSMNFGELNPIYDTDYDGSDNDMGY
jgi:hypothetical protein